jgi:hypothetical protein
MPMGPMILATYAAGALVLPVVGYNIERLRQISGLDEVSFHMSGTEAVMQAVRLALSHASLAPCSLLWRLSRLVGRRSARYRQPFDRTGNLYPFGDVRAHAQRLGLPGGAERRALFGCGRHAASGPLD